MRSRSRIPTLRPVAVAGSIGFVLLLASGARNAITYAIAVALTLAVIWPQRSYWDVRVGRVVQAASILLAIALALIAAFTLILQRQIPDFAGLEVLVVCCAGTIALLERWPMGSEKPQRFVVMASKREIANLAVDLAVSGSDGARLECVGAIPTDAGFRPAELAGAIARRQPTLLVLGEGPERQPAIEQLLALPPSTVKVLSFNQFYEYALGRVPVENLSPIWFMSVLHVYRQAYSQATKRVVDVAVAGVVLSLGAPVFAILALLVKWSSSGPAIYRQTRLGEGGVVFEVLKLRTMVEDAEASGGPAWAAEEDARVTAVGRVLRRTRLDELPQFWNVLRGDMSLVGPRPERPEFLPLLEQQVPFWTSRHLVKPGITGWAQVNVGYTADIAGAATKLSYDLYYLRHQSLWMDAVIALSTIKVMVEGSNHHIGDDEAAAGQRAIHGIRQAADDTLAPGVAVAAPQSAQAEATAHQP